jgi:hypothetical protein
MTIALVATLLLAGAEVEPAPAPVRITVRAIAASQSSGGVDPKLAPVSSSLTNFSRDFRYQAYRLVGERSFDLGWDATGEMELPASRSVRVVPRHMWPDGRVKVHLELYGQNPEHKPDLSTDFSVPRNGTILVGGLPLDPKSSSGELLLIAVTADRVPLGLDAQRGEVGATGRTRPDEPALPEGAPRNPAPRR